MLKTALDFSKRFARIFNENLLPQAAAALSYNMTMTFFPLIIVLYSMLGNSYAKAMRILTFAENLMSTETLAVIREFMYYVATHRSSAMLAAGIMVLATSASAAVRTLQITIGRMQGGMRYRGLGEVLFSVIFSVILVGGMYVVMLIMLAGRGLIGRLNAVIPIIDISGSWDYVRFILLGGIEFFLFWAIYRVTQAKGKHYRTFPGAILSTVAMVALSLGFSAVISASVRYPLVYGSLASLILLMMWLFFSSLVIYCGAALNIVLRDMRRDKSETRRDASAEENE